MKDKDHAAGALHPRFGLVLEFGVDEYAKHPGSAAAFARATLEEISQTARIEALRQFGPGTMILAHVHDGKSWSEDQMVVWLPPDGEFGR